MPNNEPAEIELRRCLYPATCSAKNCRAIATIVDRSVDAGGRPMKQYEVCDMHADVVTTHERVKGRKIIDL
jgi:hypothetical protein